jgi:hypothetical protein
VSRKEFFDVTDTKKGKPVTKIRKNSRRCPGVDGGCGGKGIPLAGDVLCSACTAKAREI